MSERSERVCRRPDNWRRSKMDKIAVNAFIHGGALSDPIELNPNYEDIFELIKTSGDL